MMTLKWRELEKIVSVRKYLGGIASENFHNSQGIKYLK